MNITNFVLIFVLSIFQLACGGGGGGGSSSGGSSTNETAATASAENNDDLSRAAVETTKRSSDYSDLFRSSDDEPSDVVLEIVENGSEKIKITLPLLLSDSPARVVIEEDCLVSGSVVIDYVDLDENATEFPQNGTVIADWNNCDDGFGDIVDGSYTFVWTGYDGVTGEFISYVANYNLTVTTMGADAVTYTGTLNCSNSGQTCSYSESFTEDGVSYSVANLVVTGDSFSGYDITARVYHESHGYIDIIGTDITYCDDGNVQTGNIDIIDSTGSVVLAVSFPNCSEFIVTYNGVSTVYSQ